MCVSCSIQGRDPVPETGTGLVEPQDRQAQSHGLSHPLLQVAALLKWFSESESIIDQPYNRLFELYKLLSPPLLAVFYPTQPHTRWRHFPRTQS